MTIISPVVMTAPQDEFQISDDKFAEFDRLGRISLTTDLRQRLSDLGHFWQGQLLILQSPRPKQFRQRLRRIRTALERAHSALNLNRKSARSWEHHMFNWAANTQAEGSKAFFADADELLKRMRAMASFMSALEGELPKDHGRRRPFDDEGFLHRLADIYGSAGGKAVAYRSELSSTGIANTPFRRFVHAFYGLIRMRSKRTSAGLDEALLAALRSRRAAHG